jgi:Trypsin-co-occurring domain 2
MWGITIFGSGAAMSRAGNGDRAQPVPLAEFVSGLRAELLSAQAARDPGLQFAVGPVSVEFTVVTSRDAGPEAKVRFWVVEAGGSARWSKEATQKMSLTLTPVDEHGQPIYIVDRVTSRPP